MQDAIVIETDRFEHRTVGAHFINPCCFGEDLAAWLRRRLAAVPGLGLELGEPVQEDYGWGLWARDAKDRYWIAVSFMGDGSQAPPAEWTISADWSAGPLRRLVGRPQALSGLRSAIRQAFAAEPDVKIVG